MTNFEMLKGCQRPEQFLRQWREVLNCGCRQRTREDWKRYCLSEKYREMDGCDKCRIDYLNEEYKEGD